MIASGTVALFVRMVVSLAFVLALVGVAALVMRRRQPGAHQHRSGLRSARPAVGFSPRPRRASRNAVQVLGRVGLTRSTAAVAVRFGDRIVLLGASDQAPVAVLAECDAVTWEAQHVDAEWTVPAPLVEHDRPVRVGFVEALREATVRRG
jgi:flagellar biogenesis protein FliO